METIAPLVDYYKYIDKIRKTKEILFTVREIEIIACLINGRGIKKIASLLLMSPKTVEVHVRNIMLKIGCNSREKIIDFIESSENHLSIRKFYYFVLERKH